MDIKELARKLIIIGEHSESRNFVRSAIPSHLTYSLILKTLLAYSNGREISIFDAMELKDEIATHRLVPELQSKLNKVVFHMLEERQLNVYQLGRIELPMYENFVQAEYLLHRKEAEKTIVALFESVYQLSLVFEQEDLTNYLFREREAFLSDSL